MASRSILISVTLLILQMTLIECKRQTLCVKGKLTCHSNSEMHKFVPLKLYDVDRGPNPDDLMTDGYTDEDGFFELCGSGSDWWNDIDPVLKVYTDCNHEAMPCKRKIRFPIADTYIGNEYDFGEIQLDETYEDEGEKCVQIVIENERDPREPTADNGIDG